ncbi:MAG: VOC family protein [Flavobacteriales bacterium]|nr:VOC family protein [Flavobacteriales bacterium]
MEILFILYVKDQNSSSLIYEKLLRIRPHLHVPGMTEFILNEKTKLGLMPESGIAKILSDKTRHPATGNGIPRAEVYLYVKNIQEFHKRAIELEFTEVSGIEKRSWGDVACYFADPDGHIIAFASK